MCKRRTQITPELRMTAHRKADLLPVMAMLSASRTISAKLFTWQRPAFALGAFVLQSALADCLPARVRTSGMAVSFGLASALVGGTAPLVASLLTDTVPVALYALVWALSASVVAVRWSGVPDVSESDVRAGGPSPASTDDVFHASSHRAFAKGLPPSVAHLFISDSP